jgi:hypothetical protein
VLPPWLYIVGGLVVIAIVLLIARRRPSHPIDTPEPGELGHEEGRRIEPGRSVGFGYKVGWMAVGGVLPARVIEALKLRDVREVEWSEGVEAAYGSKRVFVTPALGEWTLVVGERPWGLGFEDVSSGETFELEFQRAFDDAARQIREWSRLLDTTVHGYYTHRITEAHAWIRCRRGEFERSFWYVGQNGEGGEEGARTEVEQSPELSARIDSSVNPDLAQGDPVDESDAIAVATAWSLDPTRLEETHPVPGRGWIGRFPK